jgi:hypothetical protein
VSGLHWVICKYHTNSQELTAVEVLLSLSLLQCLWPPLGCLIFYPSNEGHQV